ncbi:uncharacterized protein LOC111242472 [Vigna radiata var. radiata]|uniref:Uncharacterized protein LOC111242472 n=1 Tax=Vigna radiata var. radiata TaxID=3916 RepID=A0A3Q0FG32_VIGRR|nr:uncharacterized protein LOC111242472 [Vigna radiata var. radiata]
MMTSSEAPDWSILESLILVNEIAAVEADCSVALSPYQQWKIIAQNCAALDVQCNLTQCRRKWHALLSDYDCFKRTATAGGKLSLNFDYELFKAVERVVRAREEWGMADPESNTKAGNDAHDAAVENGSKREGQRKKISGCYEQAALKMVDVVQRFYWFWLGGVELILGMEWWRKLGKVTVDWETLTMVHR